MKRFIFLLMMAICMGVANANSSYQPSHNVTGQTQIIQPPGCDFEFIAPEVGYCFLQESNLQNVFVSVPDLSIGYEMFLVSNYLEPVPIIGNSCNNCNKIKSIHYSGNLSPSNKEYKYRRNYIAGINYTKQNYIYYSG